MRTIVAFAFVGLLIGCVNTGPGEQAKKPTEEPALTADELVAWEKWKRGRNPESWWGVALYYLDTGWLCANPGATLEDARKAVAGDGATPNIKVGAVIDYLSKDEPFPVEWSWDDGSGVKTSKTAPYKDLETKLKSALRKMQKDLPRRHG